MLRALRLGVSTSRIIISQNRPSRTTHSLLRRSLHRTSRLGFPIPHSTDDDHQPTKAPKARMRNDPSSPTYVRPLKDPRWTTRREQILSEWTDMSSEEMEQIVLMADDKESKDEDILRHLQKAPLASLSSSLRAAAGQLGYSLPDPLPQFRRSQPSYHFMFAKERLLGLAWNDGESDSFSNAGFMLGDLLLYSTRAQERQKALQIAEKLIDIDITRGYALKARCLLKDWKHAAKGPDKNRLAKEVETTLQEGIERGDPFCASYLAQQYWKGTVLKKDVDKAKACWLQAAELEDTGYRNIPLETLANAFAPRWYTVPWKPNPYADAKMCLKYSLETAPYRASAECRLGMFYYHRPGMSHADHVRIWTVEPDDSKAAAQFLLSMRHRLSTAGILFSELLMWNRADIPEDAHELLTQYGAIHQELTGSSNTSNGHSETSGRASQLHFAQTVLRAQSAYPREKPHVPGLLQLCERLLKEVEKGGDGLPTKSDVRYLKPLDQRSSVKPKPQMQHQPSKGKPSQPRPSKQETSKQSTSNQPILNPQPSTGKAQTKPAREAEIKQAQSV